MVFQAVLLFTYWTVGSQYFCVTQFWKCCCFCFSFWEHHVVSPNIKYSAFLCEFSPGRFTFWWNALLYRHNLTEVDCFSFPHPAFLFASGAPLLLRLWYEPMWQEGADVAEQRVCCLRPGPVGYCCKHRLLALPGGGCHPSPQPDYRDTHVPPLWSMEGLLLGW